jgi:PncC family amidohydrolase
MLSVEEVIQFLTERKLRLSTAESCTAGMITSLLVDVPGCAAIMETCYVVYTEHAKHLALDVNLQTIKAFGLTSEEVAREMALGALEHSSADVSMGVTGTAESNDDLNGVICFAYAARINGSIRVLSETVTFPGERNAVRQAAAYHAISSLPSFYESLVNGKSDHG